MDLTLYEFWRSSCSWRVRWALAYKGMPYRAVAVDLPAGAHRAPAYLAINAAGTVPCLVIDGRALHESVAILEWLEEVRPVPALLPGDPLARARIRQLVQVINAGTQPLQNTLPQRTHWDDPAAQLRWAQFWIARGLATYEALLRPDAGPYTFGDQLTMADLFLGPQCANAERFGVALAATPRVQQIYAALLAHPAAVESRRTGPPPG